MTNVLSHLVLVQTDKTGRLLLETPTDLQNLLLLRKTKKEQKVASRRPVVSSAVQLLVTHVKYVHTHNSEARVHFAPSVASYKVLHKRIHLININTVKK